MQLREISVAAFRLPVLRSCVSGLARVSSKNIISTISARGPIEPGINERSSILDRSHSEISLNAVQSISCCQAEVRPIPTVSFGRVLFGAHAKLCAS